MTGIGLNHFTPSGPSCLVSSPISRKRTAIKPPQNDLVLYQPRPSLRNQQNVALHWLGGAYRVLYHFIEVCLPSPAPFLYIIVAPPEVSGILLRPAPLGFLFPLLPAFQTAACLLPVASSCIGNKVPPAIRTPSPQWPPPYGHCPWQPSLYNLYARLKTMD